MTNRIRALFFRAPLAALPLGWATILLECGLVFRRERKSVYKLLAAVTRTCRAILPRPTRETSERNIFFPGTNERQYIEFKVQDNLSGLRGWLVLGVSCTNRGEKFMDKFMLFLINNRGLQNISREARINSRHIPY